ncbi:hypothetical protein BDK92_1663 [Micromonospora pisi]|uniref:YbaB/EbfC DNA-binding family protein n=1 Tax=Micromonospora pisi TaxID=589240 RepID=A0A495JFQ7_9ACTN|nr:YbaB/EbfC family nucleoid-associated protein [Micromonospora pisi]RKR87388.1 hypothetical protein BDK92_1663 [Micromonospora pisi]
MSETLDEFAELEELRRMAEELNQRLAAGQRETAESSARDSREAVRVTLGPEGRVAAIELLPGWRRNLASGELGNAIVEAADEAALRAAETWAAVLDNRAAPDLPSDHSTALVVDSAAPMDDSSTTFARGLFYVLKDSFARLDEVAVEAERHARESVTSGDAENRVRVTLTGGRLAAVQLDPQWLAATDDDRVGRTVTAAVQAAYQDSERRRTSFKGSWPFQELDRMTADPAQLLADLGLATRQPRGED